MTIFDEYREHPECRVSPSLLWEYDLSSFDWWANRRVVVQRVIERGWIEDYYAALNLYGGMDNFKAILKEVPHFSDRDLSFICIQFGLRKEEMQCYTRKLSREKHLSC